MIIIIQLKDKEKIVISTSDIIDNNFSSEEIWKFIWDKLSDFITKKIDKKILKSNTIKELLWNK